VSKTNRIYHFLLVSFSGPFLISLFWLYLERTGTKISSRSIIYAMLYGAIGSAISVLLIENLVDVLFRITKIGYYEIGFQRGDTTLFLPQILLFPFLEEVLKVLGVLRQISNQEVDDSQQAAVLGAFSGAGFSSSINLVKATILVTKGELAAEFLYHLSESLTYVLLQSGTTALLAFILVEVLMNLRGVGSLLTSYIMITLPQIVYRLIASLGSSMKIRTEIPLIAFTALFSLTAIVLIRESAYSLRSLSLGEKTR